MLSIPEKMKFCTAVIQFSVCCEIIPGWIEDLIRSSSSLETKNLIHFLPTTHYSSPHFWCLGSACGTIGDVLPFLLTALIDRELVWVWWRLRWGKHSAAMKGLQHTGWREGAIEALISEATGSRALRYRLVSLFYVAQIRKCFLEKERFLLSAGTMDQW